MASSCNRFMSRSSVSSLRSAIRSSLRKSPTGTGSSPAASSAGFRIPSKPAAASPIPRFSFSRCPSELGCVQSLLPLHSTVAAARLTSCLSTTSRSSRALSQELGLSVPR
ncbi:Protein NONRESPONDING TO OXYLIPINS 2 [Cardamine amara subsp. amara]|uniref:Protein NONRESPONDING TO OXYLIPINS 2 n=1 Tax=Cardamine amara subsp. amara TaxID=228776 RepID=A0ABD1BI93_CARAN